jgi:hypothetical protein
VWKIEKIISKGDYQYALVKDHPLATKNGYVLLHRVIMENHLGQILNPNEVVHHKDGERRNNKLDNLEVLDKKEHSRIHMKIKGIKTVLLKCPVCKKLFERRYGNTYLIRQGKEFTCCSPSCRGKFTRKLQLHGRTTEVEQAISGNIVKVYRKYPSTIPSKPTNNGMRRDYTPVACDGKEIVQPTSLKRVVMET